MKELLKKCCKLIIIFNHIEVMETYFPQSHIKDITKNIAELSYEMDDIEEFKKLFEVALYEVSEEEDGIHKLHKI